jgi:prepilin-type N-terminal cleavage/methylation domain-containing protein
MKTIRADRQPAAMQADSHHNGFTLPEVLITSVVLCLVAGTVIQATGQSLRREELNAVVIDLYGWLEGVQRKASNRNDSAAPSCTVSFNTGNLTPGAVLASTNFACAPGGSELSDTNLAVFRLPNTNANRPFTVQVFNRGEITFSPRGTNDLRQPLTIEITREGSTITRCLRIEPLLGFQAIGSANNLTPSSAQDCPESSFDGAF